jgi:predicted dehydrogenase/threonine dehydrogenase-like Zn-dependent dehydrogenase
MKTILRDMRSGQVMALDVPEPELRPGGILVRTAFSAISAGTERAKQEAGEKSLLSKAIARPDLVRQVVDLARNEGIRSAYQRVQSRLDPLLPLGYSCSGVVIAIGHGVQEWQPGDRVACAGGEYAYHSEINFVPCNLAVRVPDNVPLDAAALTTIGSNALQCLRQAQVNFGETVVVIGAGLVGVLTIQLAKAAGCRVIAIDVSPERALKSTTLGADLALCSKDSDTLKTVKEFTRYGADVVIITAATRSAEPIDLAADLARDRGRIVIVGDVSLDVSRRKAYHKELSITLSRSYGPGRYDPMYEEEGVDYPIGYVRWTEKRNMEAFLQALASGSVNVARLLQLRYPVEQGDKAYAELRDSGAYTVLIEYLSATNAMASASSQIRAAARAPRSSGELRVGCIGAGSFAKNIIFPVLRSTKGVVLESVATASGIAAQSALRSFGFVKALTPADLLKDQDTDALFVLSRHDSHAQYVVAGLANHKAVFVEKPLAITQEQLEEICCTFEAEREKGFAPFVMVGFNRRFAPMTVKLREFFSKRQEPMIVHARINAGYLSMDHWTQRKTDGGRIIGESCHFVDWARSVIGAPIRTITATALPDGSRYNRDNIAVTLAFQDGSIANVLYLANGDKSVAKEYFEIFCEGRVAILHDFCALELTHNGKTSRTKARRDKGHRREIELTTEAIRKGESSPISFEELVEVSEACIAIHRAIATGERVSLRRDNLGREKAMVHGER